MEPGDIEFAIQLTDLEDWGYTEGDFRRFMRMEREGALVAWDGSSRVGVTLTTVYGRIAWIGGVIVAPKARGKGHGQALVRRAVEYAQEQGASTCWLNAYVHTQEFYESLGFKASGGTFRFEGKAPGELQREARFLHAGGLENLAAFDAPFFGENRQKVLRELYYDFGDSFFVWHEHGWRGYIVGAPYAGGVEVAPWVGDPRSPEVAERLISHLLAIYPGSTFSMNVPAENPKALEIVDSLGFGRVFETVRMHHGEGSHGIDPKGIFALGGLEKG